MQSARRRAARLVAMAATRTIELRTEVPGAAVAGDPRAARCERSLRRLQITFPARGRPRARGRDDHGRRRATVFIDFARRRSAASTWVHGATRTCPFAGGDRNSSSGSPIRTTPSFPTSSTRRCPRRLPAGWPPFTGPPAKGRLLSKCRHRGGRERPSSSRARPTPGGQRGDRLRRARSTAGRISRSRSPRRRTRTRRGLGPFRARGVSRPVPECLPRAERRTEGARSAAPCLLDARRGRGRCRDRLSRPVQGRGWLQSPAAPEFRARASASSATSTGIVPRL